MDFSTANFALNFWRFFPNKKSKNRTLFVPYIKNRTKLFKKRNDLIVIARPGIWGLPDILLQKISLNGSTNGFYANCLTFITVKNNTNKPLEKVSLQFRNKPKLILKSLGADGNLEISSADNLLLIGDLHSEQTIKLFVWEHELEYNKKNLLASHANGRGLVIMSHELALYPMQ